MPKPPIWIKIIITVLPNNEKCLPVSKTASPVTQEAEVAVNKASISDVHCPF